MGSGWWAVLRGRGEVVASSCLASFPQHFPLPLLDREPELEGAVYSYLSLGRWRNRLFRLDFQSRIPLFSFIPEIKRGNKELSGMTSLSTP